MRHCACAENQRIVEAMEHGEDIMNNEQTNDETPQWNAGRPSPWAIKQSLRLMMRPFDAAFLSGGRTKHKAVNWDFTP